MKTMMKIGEVEVELPSYLKKLFQEVGVIVESLSLYEVKVKGGDGRTYILPCRNPYVWSSKV